MKFRIACLIVGCLSLTLSAAAQSAGSSLAAAQVPPLVNFSGVLADVNGKPLTGLVGVTFSLYQEQQGGSPLWLETQNVHAGKTGNYTVALGSASSQGLPANLFAAGAARWLGVQAQGQQEQPRVLLVSVPYALKALDAETLGGKPASSFMQAPPASKATSSPNSPPANITGSGTVNHIPRFTGATTIGNSNIFESAAGNVGIAITTPSSKLDVSGTGDFRDTLTLFPTGTHPALSVHGTAFAVSDTGKVTFVSGQKFPGTGTITGVTAGTDLTGGGVSGTVTLNLDTTKVPQLKTANTFTANQTVQGSVTATSFSGNGANVTNVNAAELGGVTASAFAQLAANNIFTGSEQLFNNTVIVGPINSFTEGQLSAGATSVDNPALGTSGFTTAAGSGESGGDAIVSFGGSGDFQTNNGNSGGAGIVAEGGGGSAGGPGVFGFGGGATEGGCCADGAGGFFEGGSNNLSGDGVDGISGGGWAGNFTGSINVTGEIFAGTKDFKIDHPLDPANKYLLHASVESSEMMNIYTGNVTTNGQGEAVVLLPNWFEAVNTDFRYQLTVIGQFAQAIVAREIQDAEFAIRTSVPNVKVSWQVTAVRHDAFAKAHPLVVEQEKEARLRGFYIHPDLYGAPPEKQLEWARHPQLMRQAKERKSHQHPVVKAATVAQKQQPSR